MVSKIIGLILFLFLAVGSNLYAVEIVIDNTSTGFSYFGEWSTGSASSDKYGTDYRYVLSTSDYATATANAIWRPTIPTSTSYQVWVWYPQGWNRSVDAQYYIEHDAGISIFYSNQTIHGGQWCLLGTFRFSAGTTGYVKLTNYSLTNGKAVMADAVKFSSFNLPPMKTGGEFRSYWVDTWDVGMLTPTQCTAMLDTTRRYNYNAVLAEVRKMGDAYYKSTYETWANNISPANHDILSTIIQYAHDTSSGKPYIEVHAYMITYRDFVIGSTVPDTTRHTFWTHPEWYTRTYSGATGEGSGGTTGSMYLDPAVPDVEEHLVKVYSDVIKHYNVDGIHYDRIRYSGEAWGYNAIVSTRFHQEYGYAPPTTSSSPNWNTWCQYRRDAVTAFTKKMYATAMELNPNIKVSGAFVTWNPSPGSPPVFPNTRPYYDVFCDWNKWMYDHIVDASIPMNYYRSSTDPTGDNFRNWADYSVNSSYGRHSYIGLGWYMNPTSYTYYQTTYCRNTINAQGEVGFSYRATNNEGVSNTAFHSAISTRFYSSVTHVPSMAWKSQPTTGILKGHVYSSLVSPAPYHNGKVVYKARVIARNESILSAWTTTTDGTGFYAFIDLPPGNYTVTAYTPPGYIKNIGQTGKPIYAGLVTTVDIDFLDVPVELSRFELTKKWDADERR